MRLLISSCVFRQRWLNVDRVLMKYVATPDAHTHSLTPNKRMVSSEETCVQQIFCFMFSGCGCRPVNNGLNHTRKYWRGHLSEGLKSVDETTRKGCPESVSSCETGLGFVYSAFVVRAAPEESL